MGKAKIKRLAAFLLAATMAVMLGTGCSRHDPADDIELYWPEGMEQSQAEEPNEEGNEPEEPIIDIEALTPPESHMQQVKDFKAKNPDAVGWLYIPDTAINEVVVQDEDDNTTYHRADALGNHNRNGCLYADYECRIAGDANQISPNIVIYGHSMTDNPDAANNEKKFTELKRLLNKDFAESHPYIFFSSQTQDYVYEIFAAMYANSDDFYYIDCALDGTPEEIENKEGMDMATLVEKAKAGSIFDYPVVPVEGDKIISLSTCTYKWGEGETNVKQRSVVFGRLLQAGDSMPETVALTENSDAVMPTF